MDVLNALKTEAKLKRNSCNLVDFSDAIALVDHGDVFMDIHLKLYEVLK